MNDCSPKKTMPELQIIQQRKKKFSFLSRRISRWGINLLTSVIYPELSCMCRVLIHRIYLCLCWMGLLWCRKIYVFRIFCFIQHLLSWNAKLQFSNLRKTTFCHSPLCGGLHGMWQAIHTLQSMECDCANYPCLHRIHVAHEARDSKWDSRRMNRLFTNWLPGKKTWSKEAKMWRHIK